MYAPASRQTQHVRWSGASGASSAAALAATVGVGDALAARDLVTPRELVALMAPGGLPCVVRSAM